MIDKGAKIRVIDLAQRVPYVLACNGTALGKLSWFTLLNSEPPRGLSCAIIPGTIASGSVNIANPLNARLRAPTDIVVLSAGEYSASLSLAALEVERVIRNLEESLSRWLRDTGLEGQQAGADILAVVLIEYPNAEAQ